jgi:hypothetical protein
MPLSRKQRKDRKNRKNRKQAGGASQKGGVGPVGVYDMKHLSNSQGSDFLSRHVNQHGGMAPVGYTGVMEDPSLRLSARVTPLDLAVEQTHQVRDPGQTGGRKVSRSRKNRKTQRKNRKASKKNSRKASKKNSRKASRKNSRKASRKNSRKASRKNSRKASRKNRKQSGGRGFVFPEDMSYGTATGPGMLLPAGTNAGLHKEWSDAANVRSMMPKA